MRQALAAVAALVAVLAAGVAPAAANGPDPGQLQGQGWVCIDIPPLGLHCDNPGVTKRTDGGFDWSSASWPELVFDAATGQFLGTEVGIRDDLWHGRPCPKDQDIWVPDVGHHFCHHFDSAA